jgi:hypothetical protein
MVEKGGRMSDQSPSLETIIESEPVDQALSYAVSQLGSHLTNLHTALKLLEMHFPDTNGEVNQVTKLAQGEVVQISSIINNAIKGILIPRLQRGD